MYFTDFSEFSRFCFDHCIQCDLQRVLLGAERAVDTLHHYHKRTSATDRPTGPENRGKPAGISREYYFPGLSEFSNEIQRLAHVRT